MLSPKRLKEYIGFNEDEVRELCMTYNMDYDEYAHGMMDIVFLEMNMYLYRTLWFRQCWMEIVRIIGRRQ